MVSSERVASGIAEHWSRIAEQAIKDHSGLVRRASGGMVRPCSESSMSLASGRTPGKLPRVARFVLCCSSIAPMFKTVNVTA